MLADGDAQGAGLFLQQSVEKYLKAYMLANGWKLKKVHTLQSLLDEATTYDERLASFRDLCERVTGFYIAERYPTLGGSGLETGDVRHELSTARTLIRSLFPDEVLE